jgi:opacity protein-like surface antigen
LQIGAGLGYSSPTGDYGGSSTDFYAGTKYGLKSGFNLNAKARVSILVISAFGEIDWTSFTGSGNAEANRGTLDLSQKVFSIKLGPEYQLSIPMAPITPYLQGFVSFNTFSGSVDIQGVSAVPSGKYDIASASRIGLGAGAGVIIDIMSFKLDFNVQYHAMNIGGKEYKLETVTAHERLDNYTSLNDGQDPAYLAGSDSHFIGSDRGITAIELKLTAMFGL